MAMRYCPKCSNPVKAGDQVCSYCGLVLPFSTDTLASGAVLQKKYEIQELIHSGGMGYVYLALDKKLQRRVVVKQVKERVRSDVHLKRLEEEALQMAKLSHPNVAMVLDHFVEEPYYYLVVEFISGKTLSQIYEDRHGQLNEDEVVSWTIAICDVVSYMHRKGAIHRDISPDNIMLTEEGFIKLVDFGTLRELREIVVAKAVKEGKFGFTPPEQWEGKPVPQSDIFSIGATIYYLLTGYLPLSKEYQSGGKPQAGDYRPVFPPLRTKNPGVSLELQAIVQKTLQIDMNERYPSAEHLKQSLRDLKKAAVRKEPVTGISVDGDYPAVAPVQTGKVIAKPGRFWSGVALLAVGSLLGAGLVIGAIATKKEEFWIIPLVTVICVVPFIIPGVFLLRRGMTPAPRVVPASAGIPNWWWSLPVVLGFIGGIISWVRQKDVNRRKAMNMLTLGIILTLIWPTLIAGMHVLSYKAPPAVIQVDSNPIDFSDIGPDLAEGGSRSCTISNTGGQALSGDLTSTKDWLHVDPVKIDVMAGGKQDIKVWVDTRGLKDNFSDTGYIIINTSGGDRQIPINLTTATATKVVFEDDFSDPYSGWFTTSPEGAEFAYEDGEYSVSIKKANWYAWGTPPTRLGMQKDFTAEVDVRRLSQGSDDVAGIVFRIQQEEQGKYSHYVFWVSSIFGTYAIQKHIKGAWAPGIQDFTPSNYISRGASTNRLKVVYKGSQIEVYANGYKLTTVTDTSLTSGYVGLAVETLTSSNAHYHFDNFKLYAND